MEALIISQDWFPKSEFLEAESTLCMNYRVEGGYNHTTAPAGFTPGHDGLDPKSVEVSGILAIDSNELCVRGIRGENKLTFRARTRGQNTWVQGLSLPLSSPVILDQSFNVTAFP